MALGNFSDHKGTKFSSVHTMKRDLVVIRLNIPLQADKGTWGNIFLKSPVTPFFMISDMRNQPGLTQVQLKKISGQQIRQSIPIPTLYPTYDYNQTSYILCNDLPPGCVIIDCFGNAVFHCYNQFYDVALEWFKSHISPDHPILHFAEY